MKLNKQEIVSFIKKLGGQHVFSATVVVLEHTKEFKCQVDTFIIGEDIYTIKIEKQDNTKSTKQLEQEIDFKLNTLNAELHPLPLSPFNPKMN